MKKIFCLIVALFSLSVYAELRINIDGAKSDPTPIAIADFVTTSPTNLGEQIPLIIKADLERSNLFRVIDKDAYLQEMSSLDLKPTFNDWQAIGAHALIHGEVRELPDGTIRVSFRIWDVYANTQMEAKFITQTPDRWRQIAHTISDIIYERLTGEKGYFDSMIAFVSEKGNADNRKRRIAVMDQDGANLHYLTDGKAMAITPRFSPNMRELVYMSYAEGKPQVYIMDLKTLNAHNLGTFEGMSFAPRFSPDGKNLIFSMSKRGNSDIYLYDLVTDKRTQLTTHPAIDTSPSFSPDGKRIVFNSDRSGKQQLYVMKADGSDAQRISFGEGSYATPVWSPRGDYIAFTKIKDGTFYIGLMKPDGSGERLIANGWLVEGPSWSPNGRLLAFWRQTPMDRAGKGQTAKLYTIDVTGYYEQELQTAEDASDPAWSPLLH